MIQLGAGPHPLPRPVPLPLSAALLCCPRRTRTFPYGARPVVAHRGTNAAHQGFKPQFPEPESGVLPIGRMSIGIQLGLMSNSHSGQSSCMHLPCEHFTLHMSLTRESNPNLLIGSQLFYR